MNHYEKGITVANAKLLRIKINEVLAAFNEEGITLHLGNCSIQADGDGATFKLEVKKVGAMSQEAKDLIAYADIFKIDITKQAVVGTAGKCMLTGFRARARNKPWVITKLDLAGKPTGGSYILDDDTAKKYFGKES